VSNLYEPLLAADEPPAFQEFQLDGRSDFVIVADHASARIPRRLASLGLPDSELKRHIAWDIGALGVARRVAQTIDAPLVAQNYSRLVIDCNRDPNVATSIPLISELQEIPGNMGLSGAEIAARRTEIFDPYHRRIRALLDARQLIGRRAILVAQHTMTDVYKGNRRQMHAAVLYNRDRTSSATRPTTPSRSMRRHARCCMLKLKFVRISSATRRGRANGRHASPAF
jgi:predicted N-formylglutamate amidohydrolase